MGGGAVKLDDEDIVDGYRAGFHGWPINQGASIEWVRGWENGRVDAGLQEKTAEQISRARAYVNSTREGQ